MSDDTAEKPHRIPYSLDDAELLKQRADSFRADYRNWRKMGAKGAKNEITDLTAGGPSAPLRGVEGFKAGYSTWRKGGHQGARNSTNGIQASDCTRHMGTNPRFSQQEAAEAAALGQNWTRFFLHPDSDFFRPLDDDHPAYFDLNPSNLVGIARLHRTKVPAYSRQLDQFENIICHIGVGGFHRSHQALYTDLLLTKTANEPDPAARWGIFGLALLSFDERLYNNLKSQNFLYTLMTRDTSHTESRVIGSILDMLYAPEDRQAVIERLANPRTKIVSMTVTEKGYCMDIDRHHLDLQNPMVAHDLGDPQTPTSTVSKSS